MPTADNAKIQLELGRDFTAYELMTTTDRQYFVSGASDIWSGRSGFEPVIRPNGLVTGGAVIPDSAGANDLIDVAALTCYLAGVLTSVGAAANQTCLRGADANVCRINSVQVTAAGAISIVSGTAHTAFSEVRDASGGPPCILVGSIEIAQVRLGSVAAAPISADEIYDVVGQHCERYDYPVFEVNNIGKGLAYTVAAEENAHIKFSSVLPASHTGAVSKRVYVQYYEPVMSDLSKTLDFKPVENTHSVASTQYYGGTVGARSSSIGQGGFTALLNTGVSDDLIKEKDHVLTIKFYPDRLKTQYILTQGKIGLTRTFPAGGQIQASCTISAESVSAEFEA